MKVERFTDKARESIGEAAEIAKQHSNGQIEVEHLLNALLSQEGGVVQQIIQKVGGNLAEAKRVVEKMMVDSLGQLIYSRLVKERPADRDEG